ncbi:MAG: serine/threonine-protein kinase [Propionibacteriales bacterium]|nr:serine/threonine-protein kinase [Propionibacteriales bacterium]
MADQRDRRSRRWRRRRPTPTPGPATTPRPDGASTAPVPLVAPPGTVPVGGPDGRDTIEPQVDAARFELQGRIGAGNHGVVFRALDRHLGRQVAIKRFSHFLADDPRAMRRITREVETLARVSHPNVVTVHDLVRMPDGDGEVTPHLVMELVEGTSLRDLLALRGPSPRSVLVVAGVLDGLAACHRAGILHLDIKPANVLVTDSGGIKIVDFGIARAASDATATVAGTPHYMAPEQYDGRADERSDVYSVGCLLFETLTGRAPFEGTMAAQLMAHRTQPRPDPRASAPWVGPRLAAVVQTAMAVEPEERYSGVAAMARALRSAVADVADPAAPEASAAVDAPSGRPAATPPVVLAPAAAVAAPLVRPLSRPADLGDRPGVPARDARPDGTREPVSSLAGPAVTRWTRLVSLLLGLGICAVVLTVVPMLAWASLELAPARVRPQTMDQMSADAWWMLSVGLALTLLLVRRRRFFQHLAGPEVGSPLPDGPLAPSVGRGVRMALRAAVVGTLPLLVPWYVLGLLAAMTAAGVVAPSDPFADALTTAWVLAPLVALVLGLRGILGMRPRLGALAFSFLLIVTAGGAVAFFLLAAPYVP